MSTVFVGLSGGVDSAVSAALLKQAGHRVVGCFIKIWRPEFIDCPWKEERLDAMRVCAALEIPFREIDLSEQYKKMVIDDMVEGYARGCTPNPDVLCNRHIKFGAFLEWARAKEADFVATGHYAQIKDGTLLRGVDPEKDQSYFLAKLRPNDIARILFPVGHLLKREVREMAGRFGLPVARKKDSQGLCFVGDVTMRDFLMQYLPLRKGAVLDERGAVIGQHDGAALYTLGARHGFTVHAQSADASPLYVVALDTVHNTITVSKDSGAAKRRRVRVIDTNWLSAADHHRVYSAQARYHEMPVSCTVDAETINFATPHLAVPGQTLAIYDREKLIGSGTISA